MRVRRNEHKGVCPNGGTQRLCGVPLFSLDTNLKRVQTSPLFAPRRGGDWPAGAGVRRKFAAAGEVGAWLLRTTCGWRTVFRHLVLFDCEGQDRDLFMPRAGKFTKFRH